VTSPVVVTLGFDDGRESQAAAGQILTDYGLNGTFYLVSSFLDQPGFLSIVQACDLEENGHEIGGHTRTHPDLTTLTKAQQKVEICGGRTDLINDGFKAPVSFAYPYGSFNASAEAVTASCGFTSARTTLMDGPDSLPPAAPMATVAALYPVSDGPSALQMEQAITAAESNGTNRKWMQILWHDIATSTDPGWGDGFSQQSSEFETFLTWLQGEVNAGRVVVKTAGEVMSPLPPAPYGDIGALWSAKGGAAGFLGAPLDNESDVPGVAGARMEDFAGGTIYWSPSTDAHEVHGAILGKYLEWGGPAGYGMPVTDETVLPDGDGRVSSFVGGRSIYWSPDTDAHTVYGAIMAKWASLGRETSPLGYPITDEFSIPIGRQNTFQHGIITWNATTGAVQVS
jgi:peptidoglycan/xylan/chitin deacetylase (PgdA/CDA1 family)